MRYSIVMPFYNKYTLTHQRLYEFYSHLPSGDIEIILIDNGSSETGIDGGVAFWQKKLSKIPIRYRKIPENIGFGGAMNNGASMAHGDIIMLYSNDVICLDNFLPEMQEKFDENENILLGNEVIWFDGGWNSFDTPKGKVVVPYVNGYFIAFTQKVWNNLKGFDPLYGKYTMEDVDLSMQAQQAGYKLVSLGTTKLRHIGAQTAGYTPEREQITRQNKIKFFEKWKMELEK